VLSKKQDLWKLELLKFFITDTKLKEKNSLKFHEGSTRFYLFPISQKKINFSNRPRQGVKLCKRFSYA
jgi:hypothetical protein